jgi:hypothetical protein
LHNIRFANPGLWPGLAAVAIPVLLHLLTRRSRQRRVLPTFALLRRAISQQSRLFRLRRILLLATRVLLVLFLALAFLKPTITSPLAPAPGGRRAVVAILDVSLSMGHRRSGISSLAGVRGQLAALLDDLRPGDASNVILAGAAPRPVLPRPGADFGTLRQTVRSAEPTFERGDMSGAVAEAVRELSETGARSRELIIASDFQRTNWSGVTLDGVPGDVKIVLLSSETGRRANAGITDLRLTPATPTAGEPATLEVQVWNGAPIPRTFAVTISILKDGGDEIERTQTALVSAQAYAAGTGSASIRFPGTGRYRVSARLPADSLPADDARFLVADLTHGVSALLVSSETDGRNGAYFLRTALNPAPDAPGSIRVVTLKGRALTDTDLDATDAVVVYDVNTMPSALLARYVRGGGALILFLAGPNIVTQTQSLAAQLGPADGVPFLPQSQLDISHQGKGYVTISEGRYDLPMLKLFGDPGSGDLTQIHMRRFYLTEAPDPQTEVLLRYEDGTPAMARRAVGAGSILFCNFSPDPADGDLARQPVYPPLLQEVVRSMTRRSFGRAFEPGGSATAAVDPGDLRGAVTASGPNGEPLPISVDRSGGGVLIDRVEEPGFYTVLAGAEPVATVAVNPDPQESDLRPLDPPALEALGRAHARYAVKTGSAGALDSLRFERPLWPYCIVVVLLLSVLEQAIALLGGPRGRRPQRLPDSLASPDTADDPGDLVAP